MTTALSLLNLVPLRAGQNSKQAIDAAVRLAQFTESLGYTRYWIAEHHNTPNLASSATQLLIGHVLSQTQSIRIGSGGVMLPNHSPLMVAEQYGTLATLYPQRVDLGLGRAPSTDQRTAAALRRHFSHQPYDFAQDIGELQYYFSPPQSEDSVRAYPAAGIDVPLYILGSSTESAYLAAALGLPYAFAAHFAPALLLQAADIYRRHFQASPQYARPYFIVALNAIVAETEAEAAYLASSQQQFFLNVLTNSRRPLAPPIDNMDALWTPAQQYQVEHMTACSMIGSPDSVKTQITTLQAQIHADEIMAVSYIYDEDLQHRSYQLLKNLF